MDILATWFKNAVRIMCSQGLFTTCGFRMSRLPEVGHRADVGRCMEPWMHGGDFSWKRAGCVVFVHVVSLKPSMDMSVHVGAFICVHACVHQLICPFMRSFLLLSCPSSVFINLWSIFRTSALALAFADLSSDHGFYPVTLATCASAPAPASTPARAGGSKLRGHGP